MNPILVTDLGFSFFSNIFSSNDKKEEKKTKKPKEKSKSLDKEKNSQKDSYKSSESTYTEEENSTKKNEEEKKEEKNEIRQEKDDNKEDIKEELIEKKEEKRRKSIKKKKCKKIKKTKDELLQFLVNYIKNVYIFKKKVKILVKKHKDNFAIISSVNKNNLSMHIKVNEEEIKKVKYIHEPILNENIFYIPRKSYKKKNLVKFSFVNKKNESIIDPKFNTEYDCGEFINVINLKKIKDKEEEREEEFQTFLESYYTLKPGLTKEILETKKLSLGIVRVKKKHRTMDNHKGLVFGMSKNSLGSILKQRPIKRVTSNKKITFSEKNETISYKKDD